MAQVRGMRVPEVKQLQTWHLSVLTAWVLASLRSVWPLLVLSIHASKALPSFYPPF
jgi:hypothetical protein